MFTYIFKYVHTFLTNFTHFTPLERIKDWIFGIFFKCVRYLVFLFTPPFKKGKHVNKQLHTKTQRCAKANDNQKGSQANSSETPTTFISEMVFSSYFCAKIASKMIVLYFSIGIFLTNIDVINRKL